MTTFKTNKRHYTVVRSLDPRPQLPGGNYMSAGVFLVEETSSGRFAVQKKLLLNTPSRRERAFAEIKALEQLRAAGGSKHVNSLIESFWDGKSPMCTVILVYCDAGTIDDLIRRYINTKKKVPKGFLWHTLISIAKGLRFIHDGDNEDNQYRPSNGKEWNTICHLDLKPGNIFLTIRVGLQWPRVVIGDLGCAVTNNDLETRKSEPMVQYNGTPGWFPPECKQDEDGAWNGPYGKPTDIWQAGGVIQAMCKLSFFPNQSLVNAGTPCGSEYSEAINRTVRDCMKEGFNNRISTATLVARASEHMHARGLKF